MSERLPNGDTVVVHLLTRQSFTLNATGSLIWAGLTDGLDLDGLAARVVAAFDVEPDVAAHDVQRLTQELLAEGLVDVVHD
ncbi:MAG: PqqD family protein [Chloroflexi bacterium]|nr:PqqD family protein [Chloroflexota bacterium]